MKKRKKEKFMRNREKEKGLHESLFSLILLLLLKLYARVMAEERERENVRVCVY